MWYLGIILIIIAFILFMRSTRGNHDFQPPKEHHESEFKPMPKPGPQLTRKHENFRVVRPRNPYDSNRMRPAREGKRLSEHRAINMTKREPSHDNHSNGTPRGGGTGGSRGSTSAGGPSGGVR